MCVLRVGRGMEKEGVRVKEEEEEEEEAEWVQRGTKTTLANTRAPLKPFVC